MQGIAQIHKTPLGKIGMKSMTSGDASCKMEFYGSATVGERGQIVIPVEARQHLGLQPGDKVLIMNHPIHKGLMVFKIDAARAFLDEFAQMLDGLEKQQGGGA